MADILIEAPQTGTIAAQTGMSLDEFIRRFNDAPFELIDGEVSALRPNIIYHNELAYQFMIILNAFLKRLPVGKAFIETPFALGDKTNWVTGARVPDVMFVAADRLAPLKADPAWRDGPLTIVPDLAVEIRLPTDRNAAVLTKVTGYLNDGVRVVWVLNPKSMTVTIHTPDADEPLVLPADQTLTCELLPDFALTVQALFDETD